MRPSIRQDKGHEEKVILMDKEREKAYLNLVNEEDLLKRGRGEGTVITIWINKRLLELLDEKIRELKSLGVKTSRSDIINKLILAFVNGQIQVTESLSLNIHLPAFIIVQQKGIYRSAGLIDSNLLESNRPEDDKYKEVKALLGQIRALETALVHEKKNTAKAIRIKQRIEELVGEILEKLAGDDSERAKRYRALAKSVLKGIQAYFEEEIE